MIRNIYILLLLSLSFGTVYGTIILQIIGTYEVSGDGASRAAGDVVQISFDQTEWIDANTDYVTGDYGYFDFSADDSLTGATVYFRLSTVSYGTLPTNTTVVAQDASVGGQIIANLEFNYTPEYILGDINGDGYLDVLDIVIAIDLILNDNYDVVADVNEDGQLNVLDIVMLVDWVLNGEPSICDGLLEVELWGEYYDIESTTEIGLGGQGLTGLIPPEIGCLTNLTSLGITSTQLTGEIPSSIGNLTNLTFLGLHANQLTGEIPSSMGNLTNLTYLSLSSNQLTGEIPVDIGNLTNLVNLALYWNELTGEIPQAVCDLIESNNLNMDYILNGNNLINTCE